MALLAAGTALLSSAALAQGDTTAIVRGTVTDSGGHPIEFVELSATAVGRGVRTDSAGHFALTGMFPGQNRLLRTPPRMEGARHKCCRCREGAAAVALGAASRGAGPRGSPHHFAR